MKKEYRELYFKDMSKEGLKKLKDYGFRREEEDGSIWWTYPNGDYHAIWLDVEYWTDPTTKYDSKTGEEILIEPSELVKCNGEFNFGDRLCRGDLTVEGMETICKLYKDGLVEFRNTTGTSYELMKEQENGTRI